MMALGRYCICGLLLSISVFSVADAQTPEPAKYKCAADALSTSRILSFNATTGAKLGHLQYPRTLPLQSREIVLTFDDGPNPSTTPLILDTLDRHCVKATFFLVGWVAEKYPDLVRDIARRGHTIASHSWSHRNLNRIGLKAAKTDIERGFATLTAILSEKPLPAATGSAAQQVAPFFRFPGLNESASLSSYLQESGRSIFSCDIGTDDWRSISAGEIHRRALANIASAGRGIVVMHDTRPQTALALPRLLESLRKQNYRIVHVVPDSPPLRRSLRQ